VTFLAAVIGLSALLAYDFIWWRIWTRGPQRLRFSVKSPTIRWLENWVEGPVLLAFTVLLGWNVIGATVDLFKWLFGG